MTQTQIKFAAGLAGIQAKYECGFEGREVTDDQDRHDHFYRHVCLILERWGIPTPDNWPGVGKRRLEQDGGHADAASENILIPELER